MRNDKTWNAYVANLDKLGVKRYLEILQAAVDGAGK